MFNAFARTLLFILLIFNPINGSQGQNLNSVAVLLHTDIQDYNPDSSDCIFFDFLLKIVSEKRPKNRLFC